MYYYDSSSLIFLLPALLFALWAQARVNSTYKRYSRVTGSRGITGAQVARTILDQNGLHNVQVEHISGSLTDHYDPRGDVVRLSDGVYGSASISAVGIAAHECGHAVQHAERYTPLVFRNTIIPVTNIGSKLSVPLILIGALINSYPLILLGILAYSLMAVFQLITLPVEFNASARAMDTITSGYILEDDEQRGARKVLNAAALTYVAALASSIAQILRLLLMFSGRRGRR